MARLATGVEGFDAMVQGGLPEGSSVVLQGPPGQEKLRFALTFLAEGLKAGASGLVVISSQSPDSVLAELRNLGVNLDSVTKENRLRVVDWYSWSEEAVQEVEDRGIAVRSSIDLTNLGVALSRAIASLGGDQPRRAVIELLSPAMNVYELTQVYAFAQSAKKKFDRYRFTSLILLEKEMHSGPEITTLHQPFDGAIEIERTRSGDRILRKIGVLHLKDTTPDPSFRILEMTESGMRVVREVSKPVPAVPPVPPVKGGVLESQEERARRLQLIMQIASERLKLNPKDADALFAMAAAQATLDDARGGLETLGRLADLDPKYPGLWVLKTKLHARLGEADLARQARMRAQQSEPEEAEAAGPTVPCPMCEAPVALDATSCQNCGVKFARTRSLEDELEDLGHAAIQEMVEEELGTGKAESAPPPPEPAKPMEKKPQVAPPPKPAVKPTPKKGLTNGLVLKRGAGRKVGRTNGLKGRTNGLRGRTNGLTNGLGRTNGLTNGVGRTNGLTNGLGHTNGLTNGLGRTNGLTNGLGRTNGLTNGLGRTNGITNGLGRTNGLTNGLGGLRPTGFRSTGFRGMMRSAGWKLYLIPLVVVGLLLVPLFFVPEYAGPNRPIRIDGQFGDWAQANLVPMGQVVGPDPDVDIVRFGTFDNGDRLALYVEVRGTAFSGGGSPPRYDVLRLFLDTDRNPATGYSVAGMGADRRIEISGWGNRVNTTRLSEWDANRSPNDWNGWIKSTPISAATVGAQVELEVAWDLIAPQRGPLAVYAHFEAHDSTFDGTDYVLGPFAPSLTVTVLSIVPQVISGANVPFLQIDLAAFGGDVTYAEITVTALGTSSMSAVSSVRLVDGFGSTLQGIVPSAGRVAFQFSPRTIAAGATETLLLRADVVGTTGETLGFIVERPSDVAAGIAFVTIQARPTAQTVGYLGTIPSGHRVDAGFADWTNASLDPIDTPRRRDIDLREYAFDRTPTTAELYLRVEGRAFEGVVAPEENGVAGGPPTPGSADSDRDTVPDVDDPMPFDFNNDGVADVASAGDYDGDGILDYPSGSDYYLNTTILATFPPAYANRPVSLYIGPSIRPVVVGEDVARVFMDADNDAATGFRINVLGADYLAEFRGRSGTLPYRALSRFAGQSQLDWSWNPVSSIAAATDYSRLEASIPLAGLGFSNSSLAYFEVMDWAQRKDASADPILRIGGREQATPPPSYSPATVQTMDLSGNEKWFFTNTNSAETVCTSNKDASTTAGSAAASTTLSQAQTACWYSDPAVPDTVSGVWEVILDIDKTSDGTQAFLPSANGDVNGWSTSGCAEATEYQCVDEDPNDGDTTYISSIDSTTLDSLFNIPDWGSPPSPLSATVAVEASCRKVVAAVVDVRIIIKNGATTSVGSTSQSCANSPTYTVWSETWTTDPSDGGAWSAADINALQIGVRDNDGTTREVRVSHVKATVTFTPVYSVEINKCTNAGCTTTVNVYPATNFNSYGADVTIQTGTIAAQTLTGLDHIQWKITLVNGGTVTIRYNGPNPGTDDSRATVPVPELEQVMIPIGGAAAIAIVARRWHLRMRRKDTVGVPAS